MSLLRPVLLALAFAALLLVLRFIGFLPALAFALLIGAAYVAYQRFTRPLRAPLLNTPTLLLALKGSKLVDVTREGHLWYFTFDSGDSISVECVWRLLGGGRIVITDEDDGQMFGLPEPVSAAESLKRTVGESSVSNTALRPVSSDLLITFSNGAVLEVLPNSCGYENWHFFATGGREMRVLGGGTLQA